MADAPNPLRRPARRPLASDELVVRRLRVLRRAQLDEVLDDESVRAEETNPVAGRQHPITGALRERDASQIAIAEVQTAALPFLGAVPRQVQQRMRGAECEDATRSQHARDFG